MPPFVQYFTTSDFPSTVICALPLSEFGQYLWTQVKKPKAYSNKAKTWRLETTWQFSFLLASYKNEIFQTGTVKGAPPRKTFNLNIITQVSDYINLKNVHDKHYIAETKHATSFLNERYTLNLVC